MPLAPASDEARNTLELAASECLECAACLSVCSLRDDVGLTPAQFARQVLDGQVSREALQAIQRCALCGLCSLDCPADMDVPAVMMAAREVLLQAGMIVPDDYQVMLVDQDWHCFTLYRDTHAIDYHDLQQECYDTLFFPGCTLASYAPELTRAAHAWLEDQRMTVGLSDGCCGLPLSSIGLEDRAHQLVARLQQQVLAAGARQVVVACPNCYYYLKARLERVEVVSLYGLMAQAGTRIAGEGRLTVHDSCPDRSEGLIGRQVRHLLSGYALVEMAHHGQQAVCCGSGGIVSMVDPDLCAERARVRVEEFTASDAGRCVTACMACANRLAQVAPAGSVVHCLELVFNQGVDYARVQAQAVAMWEGEWGTYNLERLAHARPVTDSPG